MRDESEDVGASKSRSRKNRVIEEDEDAPVRTSKKVGGKVTPRRRKDEPSQETVDGKTRRQTSRRAERGRRDGGHRRGRE